MKHLVLIQYKFNPNSKEIIAAINTFRKHAKFEYEMYFLGEGCPWVKDVDVLEGDHSDLSKYPCRAQHIHVARDLWAACQMFKDRYDEFCLMSDDFFCLNDFTWEDLCVPKYNSEQIRDKNIPDPRVWAHAKWKTGQLLAKKGIVRKDYTTHCFAVYNIEKIMYIIEKYNLTQPNNDYTIEDLYGNEFFTNPEPINKWRVRLMSKPQFTVCFQQMKENGTKWLNFSDFNGDSYAVNSLLQYIDDDVVIEDENIESMFKQYNGEKGIIALTSWKARIDNVYKTIVSLIDKCPGFHIVLTLSSDEFEDKQLPENLVKLKDYFEVLWVKRNYRFFKKIAFALRKYPEVPVISADDDCIYTLNYAQVLYDEWEKTKHHIIRYTYNSRQTCLGSCTLHWGIQYPVEKLPYYTILNGRKDWPGGDDDYYPTVAAEHGYKIYCLQNRQVPLVFHDIIDGFTNIEKQKVWYKNAFPAQEILDKILADVDEKYLQLTKNIL